MTTIEKKMWRKRDIPFFYPNLIGFARYATLILSLFFALDDDKWPYFAISYTVSFGLDAVDGKVARLYD